MIIDVHHMTLLFNLKQPVYDPITPTNPDMCFIQTDIIL